ncbi:MAG: hypothetical protein KZQ94_20945 [Candidatus Thiodiazotropha sp. (ex Troendleina suluensis)]|nr:hypothetical protein [Candidatus Thiodiazotropha sp. (ex Troendleina suluensis)]
MSEEKISSGVDLGVDGQERESEFSRLEVEAESNGDISQQSSVEKTEPGAALVYPVLSQGFGILCPAWGITEDECRTLSDAYGALVDKYAKDTVFMEAYKKEITAVVMTAMIIGPRMKIPRKLESKPADKPAEGSGNEQ